MIWRIFLVCAMVLGVCQFDARAQSGRQASAANDDWLHDVTALMMFGEAWGFASDPTFERAVADALTNCQKMSGTRLGCGGAFTTVRNGWSLGVRCGRVTIVVADQDLAEAERQVLWREKVLRTEYRRQMPACVRVVTIGPGGKSVTPEPARDSAGAR